MNKKVIPHPPVGTVWDPTTPERDFTGEAKLLVKEKLEKYSEILEEIKTKMPIEEQVENLEDNNIVKKR